MANVWPYGTESNEVCAVRFRYSSCRAAWLGDEGVLWVCNRSVNVVGWAVRGARLCLDMQPRRQRRCETHAVGETERGAFIRARLTDR